MSRKKSFVQEKVEAPNMVPIMNLMTILIPFILLSVQFVHLAVIDSSLPAIGAPKANSETVDDKPPLMLTVAVTDRGFIVGGNAAILSTGEEEVGQITDVAQAVEREPTIPVDNEGNYLYEKLTELLVKEKAEYPDEQNVILIPESEIIYEVIIGTMDATRDHKPEGAKEKEMLFPFVVIAGGAQ